MADKDRDERDERWPRGLQGARQWADPADPTLPPPDPTGETEARLARQLSQRMPHLGTPELRQIQLAEAYAQLVAVAMARAEFYGELLAEAYEREGFGSLVGKKIAAAGKDGVLYEASEELRALVTLEAQERDRAATLVEKSVRLGLEARRVDVLRSYGHTVVASLKAMCAELGIPWEVETRRAAQRAILAARTALGHGLDAPDAAGAALSPEERAKLLGGGHAPA